MIFSIFAWTVGIVVTLVMGTATLLLSVFLGPSVIHSSSRIWSRIICFICGVRVEVEGLENINNNSAQIFVSNHQGFFDIFAISGYLNLPFVWIAKKSLFRIPLVGWAMKKAGYIAIERSSPKKSRQSLRDAVERLNKGDSIVIFPEGTRTRDGSLGEFRKGSLFLISKTGLPVVPMTISGSFNILEKGKMRIRPGRLKVIIASPIYTKDIAGDIDLDFLHKVRDIIGNNLSRQKEK